MADKTPKEPPSRKPEQSLKEKRAAKKAKREDAPVFSQPPARARRG